MVGLSRRVMEESATGTQVVAKGIMEVGAGGEIVVGGILEAEVGGMVARGILEAVVGGMVAGGILEVGVEGTMAMVGAVVVEVISLEVVGTGEEELVDPVVGVGMTSEVVMTFKEALEKGIEAGAIVLVQIKSGRGITMEVKVVAVAVVPAAAGPAAVVEAAAAAVAMTDMRGPGDWDMSGILHLDMGVLLHPRCCPYPLAQMLDHW